MSRPSAPRRGDGRRGWRTVRSPDAPDDRSTGAEPRSQPATRARRELHQAHRSGVALLEAATVVVDGLVGEAAVLVVPVLLGGQAAGDERADEVDDVGGYLGQPVLERDLDLRWGRAARRP